jgi:hypothetical protein
VKKRRQEREKKINIKFPHLSIGPHFLYSATAKTFSPP